MAPAFFTRGVLYIEWFGVDSGESSATTGFVKTKTFRSLLYIVLLVSSTALYVVLLSFERNVKSTRVENEVAAIIMMTFVDVLIAGVAFDLVLSFIFVMFFSEKLFKEQVRVSENPPEIPWMSFSGTQNAVEGLLETLEECRRSLSKVYLSKNEARNILFTLSRSFWRMRVFQGRVVVFRTWEPIFVPVIMILSQFISSMSINWTNISFADSLQYIEIVTITALLTVNIAPLCMNIESASQVVPTRSASAN